MVRRRAAYRFVGLVVPVGVDRGQEVDPGVLNQVHDARVPSQVFLAHELHQQKDELTAKHLVPVSSRDVPEFWLSCWKHRERVRAANQTSDPTSPMSVSNIHCRRAGEMPDLSK